MDVDWCLRTIQRVHNDLAVYTDGRNIDMAQLDSHSVQLHLVYQELVAAELLGEQVAPALEFVREALQIIENAMDNHDVSSSYQSHYRTQILVEGTVGRPRFDIPFNQLSSLLE